MTLPKTWLELNFFFFANFKVCSISFFVFIYSFYLKTYFNLNVYFLLLQLSTNLFKEWNLEFQLYIFIRWIGHSRRRELASPTWCMYVWLILERKVEKGVWLVCAVWLSVMNRINFQSFVENPSLIEWFKKTSTRLKTMTAFC